MKLPPVEIVALDQPDDGEVEPVLAGMTPGADEQAMQVRFPARSASGCHAPLFMDK